jgi:myo-inositol-1(or 4)-monophosphatase
MNKYLATAVSAAREAGDLLRQNFGSELKVDSQEAYDIKLEMDVRSQKLITDHILATFPDHAIYGEEGLAGNQESPFQWIVDPIDGTVNYYYGIPHFCVSIAMREGKEMKVGVIYDPMMDELWEIERGETPKLNGKAIKVSERNKLSDAILTVGFSKAKTTIDSGLPLLERMVYSAKKCRLMGSAALAMAYVATGRLDAYIEQGVSLWDIAAGCLLIEAAGGRVELNESSIPDKYSVVASSGHVPLDS